jgi:hypothetical protein
MTHRGADETVTRLFEEFSADPRMISGGYVNSSAAGLRSAGIERTGNPRVATSGNGRTALFADSS